MHTKLIRAIFLIFILICMTISVTSKPIEISNQHVAIVKDGVDLDPNNFIYNIADLTNKDYKEVSNPNNIDIYLTSYDEEEEKNKFREYVFDALRHDKEILALHNDAEKIVRANHAIRKIRNKVE